MPGLTSETGKRLTKDCAALEPRENPGSCFVCFVSTRTVVVIQFSCIPQSESRAGPPAGGLRSTAALPIRPRRPARWAWPLSRARRQASEVLCMGLCCVNCSVSQRDF